MMRSFDETGKDEIRDLLGKGWLTHDGAWFLSVSAEYGVEAANRLNKAAIKAMVPFEVQRLKQVMSFDSSQFTSAAGIVQFMQEALRLILPQSVLSRFHLNAAANNIVSWEWEKGECFAYKGMSRAGVIDGYECGVMYRIECWFESVGLKFKSDIKLDNCRMHTKGCCSGRYIFNI
ncbi:MAG: hypothetical protein EHM12_07830 [Dehalococcoidia bacterium]|nr:MAG: hypothetical protein EHM12_07830 [Dehalococcoidia bacterium]